MIGSTLDTIVAIATPTGYGGVGVVRLSGSKAHEIAAKVCGDLPLAGSFALRKFQGENGITLDQGLVLCFKTPHSFTGEDVVEFQGHGGPVLLASLVSRFINLGARQANPGEFTQRAYLNNKLDLAQAEAVADLIHAKTEQAAQGAARVLKGEYSNHIDNICNKLINLRVYIEASIDFVDEDIELLKHGEVYLRLTEVHQEITDLLASSHRGKILKDGMMIALLGNPNVGKSSIFNILVREERAIVTSIAGTTRDILIEQIQLDGIPFTIWDTAGIRENADLVEQEGILRAYKACEEVDHIFLVVDAVQGLDINARDILLKYPQKTHIIANKADLLASKISKHLPEGAILLSAKTKDGFTDLLDLMRSFVGTAACSPIISRQRHVIAVTQAQTQLKRALEALEQGSLECAAQDLRVAQDHLQEITGKISSDDLLGKIFSNFCIGK